MSAIKSKIVNSYRNKRFNILLVFFGIAFLFSILTKLSDTYTKTLSFKINPTNIPEDKVVLLDSSHIIDITVTSKGFDLIKYYFREPILDIDFKDLERNKSRYLWTEGDQLSKVINQLDNDFKVQNITPDSLFFKYDSNDVKLVAIDLNQEVDFKPGFDIVNGFELKPDSIKLIGPKSILDTIDIVVTNKLKLKDVNSNIERYVDINTTFLPNEVKLSQSKILVNGQVDKFTEGSIILPITLKNAPEGVTVKFYPKSVEVLFYASLEQYQAISKNDFLVECIFNSESNQTYLIPKITKQPKGVKNVRLNTKQIEYIVGK